MASNDYNPSTPPWLQNQPAERAGSNAVAPTPPPPPRHELREESEGEPEQFQAEPFQAEPFQAEPFHAEPFQAEPQHQFAPPQSGAPQWQADEQPWGSEAPWQQQPREDNGAHPRERAEITSDGQVRRVPVEDARYGDAQAPVYTWAPPQQAEQQPPPQQWQQSPAPQEHHYQQPAPRQPQSANDLRLLKRAKRPPRSGWRLAIHKASGGTINPGESRADLALQELIDRVNTPVRGDYRIAILSLKGGVGKTTTTIGLGSTFASLRGDRVIAIDANPDLGTLGHRVPKQTRSTVRDLLDDGDIHRYSDVRAHTSQAPSRLEVLASEQDPAVSEAFSEEDYRTAIGILQSFYNIILTDCGTGLMHSAMTGVLDMASALVLVTSPAIDGARSASATLDWLEHHGYGRLVERTVVVVNASRRGASKVDLDQLRRLFLDRTRAVQVVPYDEHLAEGAEIDLELVNKSTRRAFLELAAVVADDFPLSGTRHG